jgi:hypothetical protein
MFSRWNGWFDIEWTIGGVTYNDIAKNALYQTGEQDVLETFFLGADSTFLAPGGFTIGLLDDTYSVDRTDSIVDVISSELSDSTAPGYGNATARKLVERSRLGWPSSADNGSGAWKITSLQVIWTATGAWAATAGFMVLLSGSNQARGTTDGRVVAVAELLPTRRLQAANDTVKVTYNLTLS